MTGVRVTLKDPAGGDELLVKRGRAGWVEICSFITAREAASVSGTMEVLPPAWELEGGLGTEEEWLRYCESLPEASSSSSSSTTAAAAAAATDASSSSTSFASSASSAFAAASSSSSSLLPPSPPLPSLLLQRVAAPAAAASAASTPHADPALPAQRPSSATPLRPLSLSAAAAAAAASPPGTPASRAKRAIRIDGNLADRLHELQRTMRLSLDQVVSMLLSRVEPGRESTLCELPAPILVVIFLHLAVPELEALDAVCAKWRRIIQTNHLTQQHQAHQGLYVIGGINQMPNSSTLRSVVACCPSAPEWKDVTPMTQERYHCGTAVCDRKIYVFGGRNSSTRLASCEVLDPMADTWTHLPPMRSVRSAPACAVHAGYVYVFGGFCGTEEYQSVERLSTVTRTWSRAGTIAPMLYKVTFFLYFFLLSLFFLLCG